MKRLFSRKSKNELALSPSDNATQSSPHLPLEVSATASAPLTSGSRSGSVGVTRSPSLRHAATSSSTRPAPPQNAKSMRKRDHAMNALLLALESIKEASDALAPLKTTAAGLWVLIKLSRVSYSLFECLQSHLLNTSKDYVKNREDWIEFSSELTEFIKLIRKSVTLDMTDGFAAESITDFVQYVPLNDLCF